MDDLAENSLGSSEYSENPAIDNGGEVESSTVGEELSAEPFDLEDIETLDDTHVSVAGDPLPVPPEPLELEDETGDVSEVESEEAISDPPEELMEEVALEPLEFQVEETNIADTDNAEEAVSDLDGGGAPPPVPEPLKLESEEVDVAEAEHEQEAVEEATSEASKREDGKVDGVEAVAPKESVVGFAGGDEESAPEPLELEAEELNGEQKTQSGEEIIVDPGEEPVPKPLELEAEEPSAKEAMEYEEGMPQEGPEPLELKLKASEAVQSKIVEQDTTESPARDEAQKPSETQEAKAEDAKVAGSKVAEQDAVESPKQDEAQKPSVSQDVKAEDAKVAESKVVERAATESPARDEAQKPSVTQDAKVEDAKVAESKVEDDKKSKEYSDSRHQKGADLENAYEGILQERDDVVIISSHDRVTTAGFDLVYYNRETKTVVITEEKNWGSEGKPSYCSNISAWNNPRWYDNADELEILVEDLELDGETKDEIVEALMEGRVQRELVIGPHTKVSDGKLEEYCVDRLIQIDPKDPETFTVTRVPRQKPGGSP